MSDDNAKLASLGKDYEFASHDGTVGPCVIDVSTLYGQSGQFTYDPGFTLPQAANRLSPLSMAKQERSSTVDIRLSNWQIKAALLKLAICC